MVDSGGVVVSVVVADMAATWLVVLSARSFAESPDEQEASTVATTVMVATETGRNRPRNFMVANL